MKHKSLLKNCFCLVGVGILFICCQKEKPQTPPNQSSDLELWDNVRIVDTNSIKLKPALSHFNLGVYVFEGNESAPVFNIGDVIVGAEQGGYIRKITNLIRTGKLAILQTTQGTMEDVFKNGQFSLNVDMDDMELERNEGFNLEISDTTLYESGPLKIDLQSAKLSLNPNWVLDFSFDEDDGIDYFEMSTTNSSYSCDATFKVSVSQPITFLDRTDTLAKYSKPIIKWVQIGLLPVPIVLRLELYLLESYSLSSTANLTSILNTSAHGQFSLGVKYSNNAWEAINNFSGGTDGQIDISGNIGLTFNHHVRPLILVRLYGIAETRLSVGIANEIKGKVASPSLDWDLNVDTWIKATLGADAKILGYTVAEYPEKQWDTPKLTYKKPIKIERVSGDNQHGFQNQPLENPIKVRVLDSKGLPVKNVPVYFSVKSGVGVIVPTSIKSDENGYAEASWTLGDNLNVIQYAEASARNGSLQPLTQSPIEFAAVADSLIDCGLPPKIINFITKCENNQFTIEVAFNDPDGPGIEINAQVTEWVVPYQQFYAGGWHNTGNYIHVSLISGNLANGVLAVNPLMFGGTCAQTPVNNHFSELPSRVAVSDHCGNVSDWATFVVGYWSQ